MSVLLPHFPSLSKLITQMTQKEVQILICLGKRILESAVYLLDAGLSPSLSYLLLEKLQISLVVRKIQCRIKLPTGFKMAHDDLDWRQGLDQVDDILPGSKNLRRLNLFGPDAISILDA